MWSGWWVWIGVECFCSLFSAEELPLSCPLKVCRSETTIFQVVRGSSHQNLSFLGELQDRGLCFGWRGRSKTSLRFGENGGRGAGGLFSGYHCCINNCFLNITSPSYPPPSPSWRASSPPASHERSMSREGEPLSSHRSTGLGLLSRSPL